MYLKKLSLINYKNFESRSFDWDAEINCLVGNNGVGKTNILDAIYHLAYGKSYFNPINTQNIRHGAEFFVIDGEFWKTDRPEDVVVSLKKGKKKIIKRNGKPYTRLKEHIGKIPVVIISPSDRDLIIEGSQTRRKFMDGIISQGDSNYLEHLLRYKKALSQRNALLKYFAANHVFNLDNLEVYETEMIRTGELIFEKRLEFVKKFTPIFKERYAGIGGGKEQVDVNYRSQLKKSDWRTLFEQSRDKDRLMQYTTKGIHKDDLRFKIEKYPIKKFGSQGQQKTFLIALKLAKFDFIKEQLKTDPLLLLDDIFDKLDEHRVKQLIQLVTQENLGQLFISDTHLKRTEEVVKASRASYKMITL